MSKGAVDGHGRFSQTHVVVFRGVVLGTDHRKSHGGGVGGWGMFELHDFSSLTFLLQEYFFRIQDHFFWATRCT